MLISLFCNIQKCAVKSYNYFHCGLSKFSLRALKADAEGASLARSFLTVLRAGLLCLQASVFQPSLCHDFKVNG